MRSPITIHRGLIALSAAASLMACSNSVGPDDEPLPDPEISYDVQINLWRIDIIGDCDDNILGIPNQGEFSYEVTLTEELEDAEWSGEDVIASSTLYNNSENQYHTKRNDDEIIQFGNGDSARLTLLEGRAYAIHFSAIEWDGNSYDDRMNDRTKSILQSVDGRGTELSILLGETTDCQVRLKGNTIEERID